MKKVKIEKKRTDVKIIKKQLPPRRLKQIEGLRKYIIELKSEGYYKSLIRGNTNRLEAEEILAHAYANKLKAENSRQIEELTINDEIPELNEATSHENHDDLGEDTEPEIKITKKKKKKKKKQST